MNGKADYKLISEHDKFIEGLTRIKNGLSSYTIALMCAEKDPLNCHRMILICRNLKKFGIKIFHILNEGKIESQSESEKRLLKLFNLNQQELFRSEQDQLEEAYDEQGDKIAYMEVHQEESTNGDR